MFHLRRTVCIVKPIAKSRPNFVVVSALGALTSGIIICPWFGYWLYNTNSVCSSSLGTPNLPKPKHGFTDDWRFHAKDLWAKYLEFLYFLVQLLQQSLPNTYTQSVPSWFHDPLQNWLELLVKGSFFTYVDKIRYVSM